MNENFEKRRVLIADSNHGPFQILSIAQETDGSIYLSCPDFNAAKWLELNISDEISASLVTSPGAGKVSIHASGFSAIRAHDSGSRTVKVNGTPLIDETSGIHFVRHLCTLMISKPTHMPVGKRKNDYHIRSSKPLMPTTLVLFATPRNTGLNIEARFHVDVIGVPPELSWGDIPMQTHTIVWVAYTTEQMTDWPPSTHFCHYDGYLVPLFMGGGPDRWSLTVIKPAFSIQENQLQMVLDASLFDGVVR